MKKLILAAASALTLALAVPMAAQAFGHRGGGDHMAKVDTNADGTVTRAEAEAATTAMFTEMDLDTDGFLTQDEMRAFHMAQRDEMRGKRGGMKDGEAPDDRPRRERDPEKMAARMAEMQAKGAERFAAIDTDADGRLSPVEFAAQHLERFSKADTNADGSISAEEHQAARAEMKESRGKWRDKPASQ